jgi:hypothetical protein
VDVAVDDAHKICAIGRYDAGLLVREQLVLLFVCVFVLLCFHETNRSSRMAWAPGGQNDAQRGPMNGATRGRLKGSS